MVVPPYPEPIKPCRFCGKVQDSYQHYWTGVGQFEAACETWTSELWLATGVEYTANNKGELWKEILCIKDRTPEITRAVAIMIASMRRRHRYVRQNQDTYGMRAEAELPEARRIQWRVAARALTVNPTLKNKGDGIKNIRKGTLAKARRAQFAKIRAIAARQEAAARRPGLLHFAEGLEEHRQWVTDEIEELKSTHTSLTIPFAKEGQGGVFIGGTQAELVSMLNYLCRDIEEEVTARKWRKLEIQRMPEAEVEWVIKHQSGRCRWEGCEREYGFEHARRRRHEARCSKRKPHQLAIPDKMRRRKNGPQNEEEQIAEEMKEDDHSLVHWALAAATEKIGEAFHMFECTEEEWAAWNKAPGTRLRKKRVRWGASSMLQGCPELTVEEEAGKVRVHGPAESIRDLLSIFANGARLKGEEMRVPPVRRSLKLRSLDLRKSGGASLEEEQELIVEEQGADGIEVEIISSEEKVGREAEEAKKAAQDEEEDARRREKRKWERWKERIEAAPSSRRWLPGTLSSARVGASEATVAGSSGEVWVGGGGADEEDSGGEQKKEGDPSSGRRRAGESPPQKARRRGETEKGGHDEDDRQLNALMEEQEEAETEDAGRVSFGKQGAVHVLKRDRSTYGSTPPSAKSRGSGPVSKRLASVRGEIKFVPSPTKTGS